MELSFYEILLRLGISTILGSAIGIERERLNWVAGMRTHMLVCLGSTLIMMVSMFGFADMVGKAGVELDPSRVAAQVVSGIGFLGAGTIFFWKKEILRGLTTAAGLWAVAGIGLAIGGGMYFAGIATTVFALGILAFMRPVERLIFRKQSLIRHSLILVIEQEKMTLRQLYDQLLEENVKIVEIKSSKPDDPDAEDQLLEVFILGEGTRLLDFADTIRKEKGVVSVSFN